MFYLILVQCIFCGVRCTVKAGRTSQLSVFYSAGCMSVSLHFLSIDSYDIVLIVQSYYIIIASFPFNAVHHSMLLLLNMFIIICYFIFY